MARRLNLTVECVIDARNTTGESPLWSALEAALYWVDIPDGGSIAGIRRPASDACGSCPRR